MDENKAPDWGLSIKGTKQVRGGQAVEVTLEVSYSVLRRWIGALSSIPFAENVPAIATILSILRRLIGDKEILE